MIDFLFCIGHCLTLFLINFVVHCLIVKTYLVNNLVSLSVICFHEIITLYAGFPPIREFRENFEDFFQSGKSGKNRGFSAKIREKISNQGTFFQTIFKPFKPKNLRKICFETVKSQELSRNCT